MLKYTPNDSRFGNEADDLHFRLTARALQRIYLPNLLDAFPPSFRGNPAWFVVGNVEDLDIRWLLNRIIAGALVAFRTLTPASIRVPLYGVFKKKNNKKNREGRSRLRCFLFRQKSKRPLWKFFCLHSS